MSLSKRLQVVLTYLIGYRCLADVGSDHAHLAIAAAKQYGMSTYAIDNKNGPFQKALLNVNQENLSEQVTCLLQDGLTKCSPDVDIVAICGMGGLLIKDILDQHDASHEIKTHDFVLQPNNHIPVVRMWLMDHHYKIIDEAIIEERGKTYEIIYAIYSEDQVLYSTEELLFGPILLSTKNEIFIKKYTEKLNLKKNALREISAKNSLKHKNIEEEISLLERVLYES